MEPVLSAWRADVVERLSRELPGRNLHDLARRHGVTIRREDRLNKRRVGQTIEKVAGLTAGNLARRDGEDFELKSTTLVLRDGVWSPKETIKVTQLNPAAILTEEFATSLLWSKLSALILVGCHHPTDDECTAVKIRAVDVTDPALIEPVRAFWEDIRQTVLAGEIADYHDLGTHENYLQLRPTGTGKEWSTCPITGEKFPSRAFYATKRFLRSVFELGE